MNQEIKDDFNEFVRLITIERGLGKTIITNEDVDFIKTLADEKHFPRAEYILARMYLSGYHLEKDKELVLKYLALSSQHASYDIQLKIAYIYHVIGEYKKISKVLERALEDLRLYKK